MKYFNNPLNIRSGSRWLGLLGNNNGFCEFKSLHYGLRAGLYLLLKSYPKHGVLTLSDCINRWAPPFENNTVLYTKFVCDNSHLFPNVILKNLNIDKLYLVLRSMCQMESGFLLTRKDFDIAYYCLN